MGSGQEVLESGLAKAIEGQDILDGEMRIGVITVPALVPFMVVLVSLCGSSVTSPSPTPTVTSARQAIDIAARRAHSYFATDPKWISATRMTAREAMRETKDMGLPTTPPTPSEESGYLVFFAGALLAGAPTLPNPSAEVQVSWVSERGEDVSSSPALKRPLAQPDGSYVTINPTDWAPVNLTDDDSVIDLRVAAGGGCAKFERFDVTETPERVSIRAFYRETTYANMSCTSELNVPTMTVHLRDPLGSRALEGCNGSPIAYLGAPTIGDCRTASG
jgi:hypothetical protein